MIVNSFDSENSGDDSGDSIIREWLDRRRSRHQNSSIASNMSFDTQDSNAERNYDYRGDEFITEPEISFTQYTLSDAEPQRGPEANLRFHPQAEASTFAQFGHSEPRPLR